MVNKTAPMVYKSGKSNFFDWKRKNAPILDSRSPCVRNCCLDEDDICLGCFRNIEEIMQWSVSSDEQKKQILNKAEARKKQRKK